MTRILTALALVAVLFTGMAATAEAHTPERVHQRVVQGGTYRYVRVACPRNHVAHVIVRGLDTDSHAVVRWRPGNRVAWVRLFSPWALDYVNVGRRCVHRERDMQPRLSDLYRNSRRASR